MRPIALERGAAPDACGHRSTAITIVEAAYYYATPFATSLLAELGARVIKIEPMAGDPYRRVQPGSGDPVRNLGHNNMVRAMQGKESIALNLKDPSGQEIIHRLVAEADVFVHSFRPGCPESLGIDEATLRAINPKLVYQYAASYGSNGPYARQPAIDPVIAAFSGPDRAPDRRGQPAADGERRRPDRRRRPRHGHDARHPRSRAHRPGPVRRVGDDRLQPLPQLRGRALLRGQAAPPDAWTVSNTAPMRPAGSTEPPRPASASRAGCSSTPRATPPSNGSAEPSAAADLVADAEVRLVRGASPHRAELEQILEDVFTAHPARAWEEQLLAAGVGCVQADAMSHFAFLYEDPQARAIGMMTKTEHPTMGGTYWRYAPVLQLSATPGQAKAFCDWGEHSQAILAELGYDAQQIDELDDAGIIGRASERTATPART